MGWLTDAYHWTSGQLTNGIGYVVRPFSKDHAEHLWEAGGVLTGSNYHRADDPNRVGIADHLTGEARTLELRRQQLELNEKRVRDEQVANESETILVTTAQIGASLTPAGPLGALAVEGGTDMMLGLKGEAPTRSVMKLYSPLTEKYDLGTVGNFVADDVLGIRGDTHYQNGGSFENHPTRLAYKEAQHLQAQAESVAPAGAPQGMLDKAGSDANGFVKALTKFTGLDFGIGSLLGLGAGIAAMFIPAIGPAIGALIALVGGLFGQQVMDAAYTPPITATNASAPPAPAPAEQPSTNTVAAQPAVVVPQIPGAPVPAKEIQRGA